ncbi:uncharacterized conserved protein [Solibacillus silvestris StLB046]|uniref:Uncharacterized conserved protein n=1 Tax=Solibacillus silvestris (strain StLB046) TaxID=1002809 RepID=F2F1E1_SOLSS|nr:DUF4097 family beta strand repeat-containing protein [Solibacillus silvestris]OBW57064.1 hypothetical protein A9986_09985 [Solibacillus silvestris]BAK15279.1 uncharacterized conserved protein [Solibacillus silvestris StLB046]
MVKSISLNLLFVLFILTGCSTGEEDIVVSKESINDVEEIIINFASTDVNFFPSESDELEIFLTVYDNGPGVILDKSSKRLSIDVDNDITRLFNLRKKPTLEVRIPSEFNGKVILDGSSGNIYGENLAQNEIDIRASSGNIKLHFLKFSNDVELATTSGNVSVIIDEKQPNLYLDIRTNSGRQSINLTLNKTSQTKKGLQGSLGNGKNKMEIETKSGNINLN